MDIRPVSDALGAEVASELVTVGERAKTIAASAAKSGLPTKKIQTFEQSNQAVDYLKDNLTSKDIVLVKGSRGMQMEIIVAALETS